MVSAALPSSSTEAKFRHGGSLRVDVTGHLNSLDPAIADDPVSWHIEYSTALKLLNYADAPAPRGSRLVPEGASGYSISRSGSTYTFRVRRGFRFSNGEEVTAGSYARAINRALAMRESPAHGLVTDPQSTNILGLRVGRNRLVVGLGQSDKGALLWKLALPFFQAVPSNLPLTEVAGPVPSAGPYYISAREPQRVVLDRNPFYNGKRTRRLARIDIRTDVALAASYQDVRANRADFTYRVPQGLTSVLTREFGLRGRFRVRPTSCMEYIAMNTSSALFRNNPRLRRAVNYAIDRRALTELEDSYNAAFLPTDQYVPLLPLRFKDVRAYPFRPDLDTARRLAEGHVPAGGPWPYFFDGRGKGWQRMEVVRASLREIGIEIQPVGFRNFEPWDLIWTAGRRNSRHTFVAINSCLAYLTYSTLPPGPYYFINPFFDGNTIRDESNTNVAYFDNPTYNERLARAAMLRGAARTRAYMALERDLVTKAAPWAAWGQSAKPFFFSESVDTESFLYQPIYEAPPYNLLALK